VKLVIISNGAGVNDGYDADAVLDTFVRERCCITMARWWRWWCDCARCASIRSWSQKLLRQLRSWWWVSRAFGFCNVISVPNVTCHTVQYSIGEQPFLANGHSVYFLVHWWSEDKVMIRRQVSKSIFLNTSSHYVACGLILLPSELFRIVISCKIINRSM